MKTNLENAIDCVYVAVSGRDTRLTRICVASIRYFYPDVKIRILPGGPLQSGFAEELLRHWKVGVADIPRIDYGWGYIHLEPLFGPPGERFLLLDSDTVITGPVLDLAAKHDADLIVDDEVQPADGAKALYYDWVLAGVEGLPIEAPEFLFNAGQWFGKSGVITRKDFAGLVEWGSPPKLCNRRIFKNEDQGVFNFVVNKRWRARTLNVVRVPLLRWPGHGMSGLDLDSVLQQSSPPLVVHWAGMKSIFLRNMVGSDLLRFFETFYYTKVPAGRLRRVLALWRHVWNQWSFATTNRVKLRYRLWFVRRKSGPVSNNATP